MSNIHRCVACHDKTKNVFFCTECENNFIGIIKRRYKSEIKPGLNMRLTITFSGKGVSSFNVEEFYGKGEIERELSQYFKTNKYKHSNWRI
jgi:hypothetical protein